MSRLSVVSLAGLAAAAGLSACEPVDQRSFDATAGVAPTPWHAPALPGPAPKPPFLQVVAGTAGSEWQPAVAKATRLALARKPNVLFIVTGIVPRTGAPSAQIDAMSRLAAGDERAIADAIRDAGAPSYQIEMQARAEGAVQSPVIRVDLR